MRQAHPFALRRAVALLLLLSLLPGAALAARDKVPRTHQDVDHEGFTFISDRAGLEAIRQDPGGRYCLTADIDLGDAPWEPMPFDGVFDGDGHTIYNVTIAQPDPVTAVTVDGNHKEYDTVFAAFFSRCTGAEIDNLTLKNVQIDIETDQNCFAAGLIGFGEDVKVNFVAVSGRIHLRSTNWMAGISGMLGFGHGQMEYPAADVELVIVNMQEGVLCEQFLGGLTACGYPNIEYGNVKLSGFASVFGYAHHGGLVGMAHYHKGERYQQTKGYLRYNTIDASIKFFEKTKSRRAYCKSEVGENLHAVLSRFQNKATRFKKTEIKKDKTVALLPETCPNPAYDSAVTPPTAEAWGCTTYTCALCGYSYTDHYVPPTR